MDNIFEGLPFGPEIVCWCDLEDFMRVTELTWEKAVWYTEKTLIICVARATSMWCSTFEELSIIKGLAGSIGWSLSNQKTIKNDDVKTSLVSASKKLYPEVKRLQARRHVQKHIWLILGRA